MRLDSTVLAAIAAVVPLGCAGDDLPWQAIRAEEVRELDLRDTVPIVQLTREEFAERSAATLSDERLQYYADTYGRMGYFDLDLDLRPVFAASSDWVGATYSPRNEEITLVGDARDDVIVHEFVHALQDQHFDLRAFDRLDTSDAFLARRAVVEGDATLAQYQFRMEEDGLSLDDIDWQVLFSSWRTYSDSLLAEATIPIVFLDYVSFAYPFGLEYSARNLTGASFADPAGYVPGPHTWETQNELFSSRPPDTTEQVLSLQRPGVDPAGDPPEEVGLDAVPPELTDALVAMEWDTMGEWYLYLLLLPLEHAGDLADARATATGWRGDRVTFVRSVLGDRGLVWAIALDDDAAATRLAVALHRVHGVNPPETIEDSVPTQTVAGDGEPLWLERRGRQVVLAKNIASDVVDALIDAAFQPPLERSPRHHPSFAAVLDSLRRPHGLRGCHRAELRFDITYWE